jgi:hypothetical protein
MQSYFSQQEFVTFSSAVTRQIKLGWLALSGDLLNGKDAAELEKTIANFLRSRGHRSFQQHQVPIGRTIATQPAIMHTEFKQQ